MGDILGIVAFLFAGIVLMLIAAPLVIVFFERVYGPFCDWVWDLFGV